MSKTLILTLLLPLASLQFQTDKSPKSSPIPKTSKGYFEELRVDLLGSHNYQQQKPVQFSPEYSNPLNQYQILKQPQNKLDLASLLQQFNSDISPNETVRELQYDLENAFAQIVLLTYDHNLYSQTQKSTKMPEATYQINQVLSNEKYIKISGILLVLFLALIFLGLTYLRDLILSSNKSQFKIHNLKDAALAIQLLLIVFILHYVLNTSQKSLFNIQGVLESVNLDKLLMQILTFIVCWLLLGILMAFQHRQISQQWREYEIQKENADQLQRQFENLYLYQPNSPFIDLVKQKLQYLLIRQSFICPSYLPVFAPTILRDDFDFAAYLAQCCSKLQASLLRLSGMSIFMVLFYFGAATLILYLLQGSEIQLDVLYPVYLFFPLLISFLMSRFVASQENILYQCVTRIQNPYEFKLSGFERERNALTNLDKMAQPGMLAGQKVVRRGVNRQNRLFFRGNRITAMNWLHSIVLTQVLWFSWFFYIYVRPVSIYHYSLVAFCIAISALNVFILLPRCITICTITLNIYSFRSHRTTRKIVMEQMMSKVEFYEKLSHCFRGQGFLMSKHKELGNPLEESNQDEEEEEEKEKEEEKESINEEMFSISMGQRTLLRYAFILVIQDERLNYVREQLRQKRVEFELEARDKIEMAKQKKEQQKQQEQELKKSELDKSESREEEKSRNLGEPENRGSLENSQDSNIRKYEEAQAQQKAVKEQESEGLVVEEPVGQEQGQSVEEKMKAYEEELMVEVQGVSEDTQFNIGYLDKLAYLCGNKMEPWFQIILAQVYFRVNILVRLEDEIKFNDLIDFAGFNQHIIETGVNAFLMKHIGKTELTLAQFRQ